MTRALQKGRPGGITIATEALTLNGTGVATDGARVSFSTSAGDIEVFTTRPDTIHGASYVVLAPEHPLVAGLTSPEQAGAVEAEFPLERIADEIVRV